MVPTTTDTRTIRQPIEQVDKTVIDKLLTDLAAVPEGHYWTVDEGDPLHIPPTDMMVVLASTVRDPDNTDAGDECVFADFYDLNGRRIPLAERPEGWFEQQAKIRKPRPEWFAENAVHRLGDDYFVVGRGQWYVTGETTVDGERAFEMGTAVEFLARERERVIQERDAFLEANPVIEASKPWWATEVAVDHEFYDTENDADDVLVIYDREGAVLCIQVGARYSKGTIEWLHEPKVSGETQEVAITPALADEFRDFADVLSRLAEESTK